MSQETFTFQAEVGKLLDIVARSLYSHKEIFLRELISNASDACDKLRYEALINKKLTEASGGDFRVVIRVDKKKKTLSVSDNGVGMSRDELTELLGTIARSGTQAFAEQLSGNKDADMSLIGQFGVGFYSAFMVADRVEVVTRKAGEDKAWAWESDGHGTYTIADAERDTCGTDVILHITKEDKEYLDSARITNVVKTYSDHIGVPVFLADGETEDALTSAAALWTRDKKDISADQYKEFYHHSAHAFDEPWLVMHNQVEGVLSYTNLLFVPTMRPWDLFNGERKNKVKLYVNRVFITDDCEELLPAYLRFVRGVVDSEDLTLNISREMLQRDPKLAKIRKGVVKRILGELKKKADKKPEEYATFWDNFGAVVKEGLYEDFENRDKVLEISRFRSTAGDDQISLADYVGRMKEGQDAIYYITGDDKEQVARSPQLEGFRAKGIEVLLLTDPIDDFWINSVGQYEEKTFKSVTRAGDDLDAISDDGDDKSDKGKKKDDVTTPGMESLIARMKVLLADSVKDVRASSRLTDSAVCLVAGEGDMDMHMERMLKQHQQLDGGELSRRVLEINPGHSMIKALAADAEASSEGNTTIDEAARLLLDQARILEGEQPSDPQAFVRRLNQLMEKGLA
ncbi:MAG: molecular chaperone HtpG [Alphaproteobacteria bacterium]|nr:molecular chaperone HtpG [Alphaproteobacteria bacterium]